MHIRRDQSIGLTGVGYIKMDDVVMAPGNPEKVFWGPDSGNLILFPLVFSEQSHSHALGP